MLAGALFLLCLQASTALFNAIGCGEGKRAECVQGDAGVKHCRCVRDETGVSSGDWTDDTAYVRLGEAGCTEMIACYDELEREGVGDASDVHVGDCPGGTTHFCGSSARGGLEIKCSYTPRATGECEEICAMPECKESSLPSSAIISSAAHDCSVLAALLFIHMIAVIAMLM
jgi:hypothetical protein